MSDDVEHDDVSINEPAPEAASLEDSDLATVAGGGVFLDVYEAVNDAWTDIKKGFVDAMND